jgi:hypothetical protein
MLIARVCIAVTVLLVLAATAVLVPQELAPPRDTRLVSTPQAYAQDVEDFARALAALTEDEKAELTKRELKALESEPLEPAALQNLAVIPSLGRSTKSIPGYVLPLARFSLRNVTAQLMAITLLDQQQKYDELVNRMDVLLRLKPTRSAEVFASLTSLARNPKALPAVVQKLIQNPPWRTTYMAKLAEADAEGELTYAVLSTMRAKKSSPHDAELRHILSAWMRARRFDVAYFLWLDFLNTSELLKTKLVFDGEFDLEPRNLLFDWTIFQPKNVRIAVTNKPGSATDRALIIDFAGFKGAFAHVSQNTKLVPGRYIIRFQHLARNLKTSGGLSWFFRCAEDTKLLGRSTAFAADTPWQPVSFEVDVPQEGCNTQILRLETVSKAALDTQISGQFGFDSFEISSREVAAQ